MKTELAKELLQKHDALKRKRIKWEGLWDEAIELTYPSRGLVDAQPDSSKKRGQSLYSSKANRALKVWANGMMGHMISPSYKWFKLAIKNPEVGERPAVQQWLEICEDRLYSAFALSNFYSAIYEYAMDGGSIGTAAMFSKENLKTGAIEYTVRHPREICISETPDGMVDTIFREFTLQINQAFDWFGPDHLPEELKSRKNQYETLSVLHAILPSSDLVEGDFKQPYASVYLLPDQEWECSKGGYSMIPGTVWRVWKNAEEEYGRSPATDAICEINGLNATAKGILQLVQLAAEPPLNVPSELKGRARFSPRAMNYYDDSQRLVTPINVVGDLRGALDREAKYEQAIDDHFNVEFFLMLNNAEKVMTATEILEKQGEKAIVMGAQVGRLASDVLNPVIDRAFGIEMSAGRIPPPPQEVIEMPGEIDVDYLGPLAQIQKRHFKTQGINQGMANLEPMAALYPEVKYVVDPIKVARQLLEPVMPQSCMRPDDEVQALIEQEQQAQQAQAAAETAQTLAGAVGNARRTIEPNSAIDQLTRSQE